MIKRTEPCRPKPSQTTQWKSEAIQTMPSRAMQWKSTITFSQQSSIIDSPLVQCPLVYLEQLYP